MTRAGSFVVAQRYARALLDVALDKKADIEAISKELAEVVELFEAHPKLAEVLSTPAIAAEKRVAVLDDVLSRQKFAPATVNVLKLLTTRDRIPLLSLVVEQYRLLVLEHKKIQYGEVASAYPLSTDQQKRLAAGLGAALGKTMELSFKNDPSLLGGIVVRVGNRIFDASVVTQLVHIKEKALAGA